MQDNNEKNDLHYAIVSTVINESEIFSGCIYTNFNKSRQNPYSKFSFAIYNLFNDNSAKNHNDKQKLVINCNLYGDKKLLNDWNDPDLFRNAFFALFFYKNDGHITPWFTKVSFCTWAKWALSHYSRYFAWYSIFIYVVYDIMQRRSISLKYSLLVKSRE